MEKCLELELTKYVKYLHGNLSWEVFFWLDQLKSLDKSGTLSTPMQTFLRISKPYQRGFCFIISPLSFCVCPFSRMKSKTRADDLSYVNTSPVYSTENTQQGTTSDRGDTAV